MPEKPANCDVGGFLRLHQLGEAATRLIAPFSGHLTALLFPYMRWLKAIQKAKTSQSENGALSVSC
jgi:hypothetical protein